MVELKLDVSKRFMILASIVLIFGTVAGVGFAGEGHFNLPLAWVLDKDGNSVDANDDGVVDNSEKVEGLSASDLLSAASAGDLTCVTKNTVENCPLIPDYGIYAANSFCCYLKGGNEININICTQVNDGTPCAVNSKCWDGQCLEIDMGGDAYCRDYDLTGSYKFANNNEVCGLNWGGGGVLQCLSGNCVEFD